MCQKCRERGLDAPEVRAARQPKILNERYEEYRGTDNKIETLGYVEVQWENGEQYWSMLKSGCSANDQHRHDCVFYGSPIISLMSCLCGSHHIYGKYPQISDIHEFNERRNEMRELTAGAKPGRLNEVYQKLAPGGQYKGILERISRR